MMNVKNLMALGVNAGKVVLAFAASVAVAEAGIIGANAAVGDARFVKNTVKEKVNPTPIAVKEKHLFGKKATVKVDPITGTVSEYHGDRVPENKKHPVKVAKINKVN